MKKATSGRMNASTKRTMKLLTEAFLSMLETQPLEKITIMDICKKAGVPRATFYNHFDDKYDLLRFSLKTIAQAIIANGIDESDSRAGMISFINNALNFSFENYTLLKKISSANYNSILFSEVKILFYKALLQWLETIPDKGRLNVVNVKTIAEFYSNAIVYSAKTWIENDMDVPRDEVLQSLLLLTDI